MRRTLLKEVAGIRAVDKLPRNPSLLYRLRQKSPDDARMITEAVVDWLEGGHMRVLFDSKAEFHRYLMGQHQSVPCDPPVLPEVDRSVFVRLIDEIDRERQNGKEITKSRARSKRR